MPACVGFLRSSSRGAAGISRVMAGHVFFSTSAQITTLACEVRIYYSADAVRVLTDQLSPRIMHRKADLDVQVQRAAAGALRTLAFKNEDNKNQIVECGALPTLIQMLQADDAGIHYEAVGVIGNLVHSSIHIKRQVGSLPPSANRRMHSLAARAGLCQASFRRTCAVRTPSPVLCWK